jgi:hypothetical protein
MTSTCVNSQSLQVRSPGTAELDPLHRVSWVTIKDLVGYIPIWSLDWGNHL